DRADPLFARLRRQRQSAAWAPAMLSPTASSASTEMVNLRRIPARERHATISAESAFSGVARRDGQAFRQLYVVDMSMTKLLPKAWSVKSASTKGQSPLLTSGTWLKGTGPGRADTPRETTS